MWPFPAQKDTINKQMYFLLFLSLKVLIFVIFQTFLDKLVRESVTTCIQWCMTYTRQVRLLSGIPSSLGWLQVQPRESSIQDTYGCIKDAFSKVSEKKMRWISNFSFSLFGRTLRQLHLFSRSKISCLEVFDFSGS